MATKENKGGELTNKQVEEELKIRSQTNPESTSYKGAQDNGDDVVREHGTDVQQRDGFIKEDDRQ